MRLFILFFLLGVFSVSRSQIADFNSEAIEDDFLYNLNLYSEQYAGAVVDAYGVNQAIGWQVSGEVLKPFAFSVGLQSAVTFLKSSDESFNFNRVPFSDNLRLENPTLPELPTVIGGETNKNLIYKVKGTVAGPLQEDVTYEKKFSALNGIKTPYNALPVAALLVGTGLPFDIEVTLRYFPKVTVLEVDHYEYGFGAKHMISRYFMDKESPLHISVGGLFNYSKFSYVPEDLLEGENQNVTLIDRTFNFEAIGSYEKKYYSFFALVAYYSTDTDFRIKGTYRYEVEQETTFGTPVVQEAFSVTDPVNLSSDESKLRAAFGASAKYKNIAVLALAYNISEYNSLSLNLIFKINNGDK